MMNSELMIQVYTKFL